MKKLHIGQDFTLPVEAVTETFLDLGQRGAGKTNTAAVMAEELFAVGAPFAVLTPIDNWWGLKSSADGKGPGLPIYIFGGRHADLPLAPTAGRVMADVLIDQRISCVICTQGFSGKERAAFVTDLAERLLDKNSQPLHLIVEEADAFIPQRPYPGEERMLGAMDRLIRWGRSPSAIGGTFISQRSAKINKDITTQCSVLLAHRTMAPQDVEAIKEWFRYHPDTEKQKQMLAEIASIPKGTAFIYSPAWLEFFGRIQIRRRHTFDSAATPKLGASIVQPKTATVDLKILEARMAETIEKAKAEDPRELRRRIQELEGVLRKGPAADAAVVLSLKREMVMLRAQEKDWEKTFAQQAQQISDLEKRLVDIATLATGMTVTSVRSAVVAHPKAPTSGSVKPMKQPSVLTAPKKTERTYTDIPPRPRPTSHAAGASAELGKGEIKVLTAIAQHRDGVSREQLTVLTGYKRSSRDTYLQRLGARGLIDGNGSRILATEAGVSALGSSFQPLPKGEALREHWMRRLSGGEREILNLLIGIYPSKFSRDDISHEIGYKRSSRDTYLQRLQARKLIDVDRDGIKASDLLFEE